MVSCAIGAPSAPPLIDSQVSGNEQGQTYASLGGCLLRGRAHVNGIIASWWPCCEGLAAGSLTLGDPLRPSLTLAYPGPPAFPTRSSPHVRRARGVSRSWRSCAARHPLVNLADPGIPCHARPPVTGSRHVRRARGVSRSRRSCAAACRRRGRTRAPPSAARSSTGAASTSPATACRGAHEPCSSDARSAACERLR
jgi:hypothetical protein